MKEQQEYNNDTNPESDFVWVWKKIAQSVYPTAKPIRGFISKDTANSSVWSDRRIDLLALDSIKDVRQWQDQLEGIDVLHTRTILALNDFLLSDQPTMVYACLRQEYLIPIFTCWDFWEPWIFVVKKTMSLRLPCKCMKKLQDNDTAAMEERVRYDLDIMGDSSMITKKNLTMNKLIHKFRYEGQCNTQALRNRAAAGRIICSNKKNSN